MSDDSVRIGLICVQNAGRSQMATAFAEAERERRGLESQIEILTGGTDPADEVHPVVVDALAEIDIDVSDHEPQAVSMADLEGCDIVATMGCSTLEIDADVDVRDWALSDPHGQSLTDVRAIRATVRERVESLFDELETELGTRQSSIHD